MSDSGIQRKDEAVNATRATQDMTRTTPCNGHALRQASRRVSQLYDAVIAPCGLRSTQRAILAQVARSQTSSIGELAQRLTLDRSALAHNLKPLARDRYLTITADPQDKRSRRVSLTSLGAAKLEESNTLWHQAQERFEVAFGADRAEELRRALGVISSSDFAVAFDQSIPVNRVD